LEDAIETTGRAFLGLTLRCARCHDHKFDPVTQRDYYALYGIFASTTFPYAGSEEFVSKKFPRANFSPLVDPLAAQPKIDAHKARLAALEHSIRSLPKPKSPADNLRLQQLQSEHSRLLRSNLPPDLPLAYAVSEGPTTDSPIHRRGEPSTPGPVVPRIPRFPFLATQPPPTTTHGSGRLEFARWLTQASNPLTPRVLVNRIWQHHFGKGIVATPSNFGIRGELPSHPELLDHLANRFLASNWSIKSIHRDILLSRTYRLSSQNHAANDAIDPQNRLLWRHDRRRLDAESIRDAMLAVAGQLDLKMAGQHPFPPIEAWHWTQHDAFKALYPTNRRGVYLMTQRLVRHPFLALFDGPDTNASTDLRTVATVPLQALYLMNNPFVIEQATHFAYQLLNTPNTTNADKITLAYQQAWSRTPSPAELSRIDKFLSDYKSAATIAPQNGSPPSPNNQETQAWTALAKILITANEFLYID
jgi:hypothetical protein